MIKIRKYQEKDENQVKKLIMRVLTEIFKKNVIKEWENFQDYAIFYLAEDNGKIVGTIALKNQGSNTARLKRMYVDKNYRKKGLGQELYNELENFAKNNKYRKISLTTGIKMDSANKFYEKNGYKKLKKVNYKLFPELKNEDVIIKEVVAYEKTLK